MPEYEELRLSVTLDDQATPRLQRLRGNFQQVFSTQNIAQLDRRRDFPPSWPLLTFSKDNKR
jgi:hypothetical protein